MNILLATVAIAAAVWSVIALIRGSVFLSTAIFLAVTACFPAEFFAIDAGGLTWTLNRLWLVALLAQAAFAYRNGRINFGRIELLDISIGLFFTWLVARTITQPLGSTLPGHPPTLMHLIDGYFVPFLLYFILRSSQLEGKLLKPVFFLLVLLGLYFNLTAFLEIAKLWSLVFPKFIGDPSIGIHFGRARGPLLQSVRFGICLIACWIPIVIFGLWARPLSKASLVGMLVSLPLSFGAVFLTYTRSVWMGLAAVIGLLTLTLLNGVPRRFAIFGMMSGCVLIGLIKGPDLVAFKREFSAAETRESTYMRAAFAYVSIEMIKDRPVTGFGFNQFQVYNLPYLSDRSTDIRIESIRGYVHHNSYLSLLVDLGIVGFALYAFVVFTASRESWHLWRAIALPRWVRGLGLAALAVTAVHLIQMMFHEVSFSSVENGFLFAAYGLVLSAKRAYCYGAGYVDRVGDKGGRASDGGNRSSDDELDRRIPSPN